MFQNAISFLFVHFNYVADTKYVFKRSCCGGQLMILFVFQFQKLLKAFSFNNSYESTLRLKKQYIS